MLKSSFFLPKQQKISLFTAFSGNDPQKRSDQSGCILGVKFDVEFIFDIKSEHQSNPVYLYSLLMSQSIVFFDP